MSEVFKGPVSNERDPAGLTAGTSVKMDIHANQIAQHATLSDYATSAIASAHALFQDRQAGGPASLL